MYSGDRWQIYDEAGNYLMEHYTPKHAYLYDCGEYSFIYEASTFQMSSWTMDGTLSFQVRPTGFNSSTSCSGGDYITASLGQGDKLTNWNNNNNYYLYLNNLPQLNESVTFNFNFKSYYLIRIDYWGNL